jgi:hypothetical protein
MSFRARLAYAILLGVGAPAFLTCLTGCGRKATEADCTFIVDRNVEVQMKQMNITDPAQIAKRKDEIRAEFKESLKDCVGKRVTDGMIACVQRAQVPDEIDKCMH